MYKIFVINPGSTSTKIGLYEDVNEIFTHTISHSSSELDQFLDFQEQLEYRIDIISKTVKELGHSLEDVGVFVGRGGGFQTVLGGVYKVNDLMVNDAIIGATVRHPANLGCQIASHYANQYGTEAYIVSAPVTDEFEILSRITGIKGIYRESRVHALNQKEIAIQYGDETGKKYEDLNLVVAHIGGGISITAHKKGKMVDSTDCANGDGPMAPTRAGAIPATDLVRLCYSGKYTQNELYRKCTENGGLVDHIQTSDLRDVKEKIKQGDKYSQLLYNAMAYQVGKYIGAYAPILHGQVDAIILTGGIVNDTDFVERISKMINYIGPVVIKPGEEELIALSMGALRVLQGKEKANEYTGKPIWDKTELEG